MATSTQRLLRAFVGRALSLLSWAGIVVVPTAADANVEHERVALERRIEVARQVLRESAQDPQAETHDKAWIEHVAQQRKRNTWNNWPNWNNWANWFNR